MKIRSNFYLDSSRLEALKHLADSEETSISNLVREGIDRVIFARMNEPRRERHELRANLEAFLQRHAGTGPNRTVDEIEELVSSVDAEARHRKRSQTT